MRNLMKGHLFAGRSLISYGCCSSRCSIASTNDSIIVLRKNSSLFQKSGCNLKSFSSYTHCRQLSRSLTKLSLSCSFNNRYQHNQAASSAPATTHKFKPNSTKHNQNQDKSKSYNNDTGKGINSFEEFGSKFKESSIMASLSKWEWLMDISPGFPVHGDQLKIIQNPEIFYKTLVEKAEGAKFRISNASLYLGNGELEKNYISTIHENLKTNNNLKIKVLLDFTRGSRGNGLESTSRAMLLPLLKTSTNAQVYLFHTPTLRGFFKRFLPQRWNEIIGLQHMKIYVFDNDIIISGANLSNDYFTNRQDRYLLIEGASTLADFYDELIDQVCNFSFQLNEKNETNLNKNWAIHPATGNQNDFITKAKYSVLTFYNDWKKGNPTRLSSLYLNLSKPLDEQAKIIQQKHDQNQSGGSGKGDTLENDRSYDTWIFPLIQMGPLDINLDNLATSKIFEESEKGSLVRLATGYFNLTSEYVKMITERSNANYSILMAHPKANGFLGAKFPAGGIPSAYTLVAKKFLQNIKSFKQDGRIDMWEYFRQSWTFHAKGLWFYPPGSKLPLVTLVGSPNFGHRSVYRDLETQLYIISINEGFRKSLDEEQKILFSEAKPFDESVLARQERIIPLWVKMVIYFFRNFF